MLKQLILGLAFIHLSACATKPLEFASGTTSDASIISNSILKNNVSVENILGARKAGDLIGEAITNDEFVTSLQKSLAQNGMLSDGQGDYTINAEIIRVRPGADLSSIVNNKTVSKIRYKVINNKNNELVMDEIITAEYAQKFMLNSGKRLILSTQGAVKINITEFIKQLTDAVVKESDDVSSGGLIISLNLLHSKAHLLP